VTVYVDDRPTRLTQRRSFLAPASLAAYALGATLWTPTLLVMAWLCAGMFAWLLPAVPVFSFGMVAALWTLRFLLYAAGAGRGWDYGYGINGVIVNRRLPLADKARRIATDWFGIVLALVWLGVAISLIVSSLNAA
jgi:hypothetical protein